MPRVHVKPENRPFVKKSVKLQLNVPVFDRVPVVVRLLFLWVFGFPSPYPV